LDQLHRERGTLRGLPTGFKELDGLLAGFQKSDLIILAARPSVGKTSFALDIARHAAVRGKAPVGVFSLEMSKEQLVDRMLCAESGVNLWNLRTGNLSDRPDSDDFPRIGHAMGVLSEAPIFIDDQPGNNVMHIRTKARRLQAEHGLGLIIIDYLQLMESHRRSASLDNRVQEVSEISRNLKGIARELNVPVLALSQLSRAVEQSKPAMPKLAHLRESGSIEQDADVVLFIYRKAADRNYRLEDIPPDERRIAEIHVAKHRNGPTGMVRVFFDEARASYRNLDKAFTPPPVPAPQPRPAIPSF
jgi:replicative DNA helicase